MVRHIRHSVYILTENIQFEKPFSEGNCHFSGEYSVILSVWEAKKVVKRVFSLVLCASMLLCSCACALTRSELRSAWQAISNAQSDVSPYLIQPDVSAFSQGDLTPEARENALSVLNLLREIAGLNPVELNDLYNLRAQNGALLLAANDFLEHDSPQPRGMDDAQYESAHMGTSLGSIARFHWMRPEILIDGVTYFARDDGSENLAVLGHRRWMLNPEMAFTGFGLANSETGMSYVTMYAVDDSGAGAQWDYVAWPAGGCFPVELMRRELAWSVSLNEEKYDLSASNIEVYIKEVTSGAEFCLHPDSSMRDGFCTLSTDKAGSGPCLIFRPEIADQGLSEYLQNQIWQVEIRGLVDTSGSAAEIAYTTEMVSLYAQDVASIELSQTEAEMQAGQTLQLAADVIPSYADDLSLIWGSSDPKVASVNADGLVTALCSGECSITAMGANSKKDVCTVTVK